MMSMWRSALLLATGLGLIACGETLPSPDTHICTEEEQALSTLRALQPLENGIRAALYPSRPRYPATQLVDITIDLATAWGSRWSGGSWWRPRWPGPGHCRPWRARRARRPVGPLASAASGIGMTVIVSAERGGRAIADITLVREDATMSGTFRATATLVAGSNQITIPAPAWATGPLTVSRAALQVDGECADLRHAGLPVVQP